mgnify:CR=1 FL=1
MVSGAWALHSSAEYPQRICEGFLQAGRRNRELEMTEFYNLVYQYENDCLKAALEYNKSFYSDNDIKPEEELLFTLTIVPFSKISSVNFGE